MATIYEQLGGTAALESVVADFYVRVLADDELAGFFKRTNMARLKAKQVEFFAAALRADHRCDRPLGRRHRHHAHRLSSPVDHLHLLLAVVLAGRGGHLGQLVDLLGGQFDSVGRDVLLDPGHPLGTRNRRDVITLSE
jgi:Bacterial-like globin